METVKVLEIHKNIFDDNDQRADILRSELRAQKTFLLNVMSSPGAGKTSTLTKTINALKEDMKICVMEADIDSDVDACAIQEKTGVEAIQLHTGGRCHLDSDMTRQGINGLTSEKRDLIILENVGNLVCPAEFDTGAAKNVMILSVPEGDDKPLKYPLIFSISDVVLINKMDTMEVFNFDLEAAIDRIHRLNPETKVFPISAKTGEGMEAWTEWLKKEVKEWNQ